MRRHIKKLCKDAAGDPSHACTNDSAEDELDNFNLQMDTNAVADPLLLVDIIDSDSDASGSSEDEE